MDMETSTELLASIYSSIYSLSSVMLDDFLPSQVYSTPLLSYDTEIAELLEVTQQVMSTTYSRCWRLYLITYCKEKCYQFWVVPAIQNIFRLVPLISCWVHLLLILSYSTYVPYVVEYIRKERICYTHIPQNVAYNGTITLWPDIITKSLPTTSLNLYTVHASNDPISGVWSKEIRKTKAEWNAYSVIIASIQYDDDVIMLSIYADIWLVKTQEVQPMGIENSP